MVSLVTILPAHLGLPSGSLIETIQGCLARVLFFSDDKMMTLSSIDFPHSSQAVCGDANCMSCDFFEFEAHDC